MEVKTIAVLLKGQLPRLKIQEEACDLFEKENPYTPVVPLVERATYVGIELEIENCPTIGQSKLQPYWHATRDGSLRNNGVEYISNPLKVSRAEQALDHLLNKLLGTCELSYSSRTSTHIHMNVRTLTIPQIQSLVLTYMIFEKALFNWVGHDREKNIFCVPLHSVVITRNFCQNLDTLRIDWEKYTALNLAPITNRGTIEFRHLNGTRDIRRIMTWINFLLCLKKFALRRDPQYIRDRIYGLNTISDYWAFTQEVFGDLAHGLLYDNLNKDMSFCVSNIKSQAIFIQSLGKTHAKLMEYYSNYKGKLSAAEILNKARTVRVGWEPQFFTTAAPVRIDDNDIDQRANDAFTQMMRGA